MPECTFANYVDDPVRNYEAIAANEKEIAQGNWRFPVVLSTGRAIDLNLKLITVLDSWCRMIADLYSVNTSSRHV